jgi:hypothetical protein
MHGNSNHILIVHSEEPRFAKNEQTMDAVWGSFEMLPLKPAPKTTPANAGEVVKCDPVAQRRIVGKKPGGVCVPSCDVRSPCVAPKTCAMYPTVKDDGHVGPPANVCITASLVKHNTKPISKDCEKEPRLPGCPEYDECAGKEECN